MPKDFESCVRRGGRVRTKKLGGRKYMHICFIDGKSFAGETKTRVTQGPGGSRPTVKEGN